MPTNLNIGHKLNNIRLQKSLSQNEMADLLGVSPSAYGRVERNETSIAFDQVLLFASKLGIPIQEFLPETITVYNSNNTHQGGGYVGTVINNYYTTSDEMVNLLVQVKALEKKIDELTKR
jgi:transcriptional regulator with XRE-family HTH domain